MAIVRGQLSEGEVFGGGGGGKGVDQWLRTLLNFVEVSNTFKVFLNSVWFILCTLDTEFDILMSYR